MAAHAAVAGAAGAAVADPNAAALALLAGVGDLGANAMQTLADRKRALEVQKKAVAKEMKSEQRKRKRMLDKAKNLSDADLLSVVATRQAQAKAKAKAKAAH
jgi:hypothetical protein